MPIKSRDQAKSYNEANWPGLLAITLLNLVAFGVVTGISPTNASQWALLLPAGVGLAMIRVVNGQFNGKTKTRLVYWKWKDPLPGSRALRHAENDDRLRGRDVDKILGPFPPEPAAHNSYWYGIYSKVSDAPSVSQANRNYLFTRDYTAISFFMMIALGAASFWQLGNLLPARMYAFGLILQYLLVRNAARNYGIEVVTNVLAVAAASNSTKSKNPRHSKKQNKQQR